VNRSVADAFREAGQRHLAALVARLPTDNDERRFFEAAKAFLSFDGGTRRLPSARRKALLNAPIETADTSAILASLWAAVQRVLKENPPGDSASNAEAQLFGYRVLMARLIVGGLHGASDRRALTEATLQLREMDGLARLARSESAGKSGRLEALSDTNAQRERRSAWLRTEAEKVRRERPNLGSQVDRANTLNKRAQKAGWTPWRSNRALIAYAYRNHIKI
jgi:hypothetical protein